MAFVYYDLAFLVVFVVLVVIFLSTRKKNLTRQGILYLYRTQIGVKFIDVFAKKYRSVLRPLQYVVLFSGFSLMVAGIYLFAKSAYIYMKFPVTLLTKAPPVAPLIPYFPKIFGLESFFPPLYFTYFLIALAVVAISHEFAHGIYARFYNLKVKATGFAFLGPVLGAFVEPDEKEMSKAKKIPQMTILAAGTFANVLMTILFSLILIAFFSLSFVPEGVKFNAYSTSPVNLQGIELTGEKLGEYSQIIFNNETYYLDKSEVDRYSNGESVIVSAYDDSPAFRSGLRGAITEVNGVSVRSRAELQNALSVYSPGDEISVETILTKPGTDVPSGTESYDLVLGERNSMAFMGIAFYEGGNRGFLGKLYDFTLAKVKKPLVLYESKLGEFGWFVYYLLWWLVTINLLVALFNMLPLGILDGGKFFYLTMLGIFKKEKVAVNLYKFMTWFLLALLVLLMVKWAFSFL